MSLVYHYSDLHAGHTNVHRFRTQFSSEEEHYEYCRVRYFETINRGGGKRALVFCYGDMHFTRERMLDFAKWPGRKVLLVGNHDTQHIPMKEVVEHYEAVHSLYKYKGRWWLSHVPMHPDELRGRVNIHGHTHFHKIGHPMYVNVCLEHTDFRPVSTEWIEKTLQKQIDDWFDVFKEGPRTQWHDTLEKLKGR